MGCKTSSEKGVISLYSLYSRNILAFSIHVPYITMNKSKGHTELYARISIKYF